MQIVGVRRYASTILAHLSLKALSPGSLRVHAEFEHEAVKMSFLAPVNPVSLDYVAISVEQLAE